LVPDRDVRRPGRRTPPPRGRGARRTPRRRVRQGRDHGRGEHPHPRTPPAGDRGARRRGLGALRRRLPRLDRRLLPRRGRPDGGRDRRHLRQRRAGEVTLVLAVAAGLLIGLSLGALGGGGSILAVPVLVYLLDQSATQ